MVGVAAGVLTWMSRRDPFGGILAGAGAFAGAVLLLLEIAAFL
nr:hypothetical protein asmbl_10 [uncultured bacterium]